MRKEQFGTFSSIPDEEKNKYKQINENGDYALEAAIENVEASHGYASILNDCSNVLEEGIKKEGLGLEDAISKLEEVGMNYSLKNQLIESLLQHADLARLSGHSVDDKIKNVLQKTFTELAYSKVLSEKINNDLQVGDPLTIGAALSDDMLKVDWQTYGKLKTDDERVSAFEICKKRISAGCKIIESINDIDLSVKMYTELSGFDEKKLYKDRYYMDSTGKALADKIYKNGGLERLNSLVEAKILKPIYFKDFLHELGNTPKIIANFLSHSTELEGVEYGLKFISSEELLEEMSKSEFYRNLSANNADSAANLALSMRKAVGQPAKIVSLSGLNPDEMNIHARQLMAANKFVIGLNAGQSPEYVIAMSNIGEHEYHKDIFSSLGQRLTAKSGGYVGMTEEDGRIIVRMERSSGDFGYYSQSLLEKNREKLEASFKEILNVDDLELVIKPSTYF